MSVIENNNRDEYIVHFGDSEYEVFCDLEDCEKYIYQPYERWV
jgi:hypothetical protein